MCGAVVASGAAMPHAKSLPSGKAIARRRWALRLCRGPVPLALAACLLDSCSIPDSLFRFAGAPPLFDEAASARPAEGAAAKGPETAAQDAGSHAAASEKEAAPEAAAPAAQPIGVAFKPAPPFAAVRNQLARLLRNGSMAAVPDERITDGVVPEDARYFVQIGAHQMRSAAEQHFGAAADRLSPFITGLDLRIRPAHIFGQGNFFRVQIGPLVSQGAALDLCRALKARQQACITVAEKEESPAGKAARAPLDGGWASIAPAVQAQSARAELREGPPMQGPAARQVADAAPLYTSPGMPGLPE